MIENSNMLKAFIASSRYTTQIYRNKLINYIYNPYNLTVYDDTIITTAGGSILELNGELVLCSGCTECYNRPTILKMDRNAKLIVSEGVSQIYYGTDVHICQEGRLEIGKDSVIKEECKLVCKKSVIIGEACVIEANVTITDEEADVENDTEQPDSCTEGVIIGNHVHIGAGAKISKGARISDGAVIAPGMVVTKDNCNKEKLWSK